LGIRVEAAAHYELHLNRAAGHWSAIPGRVAFQPHFRPQSYRAPHNGEFCKPFPLRWPRITRAQATFLHGRGTSINDFINEAVAEKIARLTQNGNPAGKRKPAHAERREPNKKRPGATRASGQP